MASTTSAAGLGEPLAALAAPVHALPLDVFRILAGMVGLAYFASLLRHRRDFTFPDGLIDHGLTRALFPPTRMSLFHPAVPPAACTAAFVLGAAASVAVVLGWHPRAAAVAMFVVAVSAYRWNLLVVYVDDAIMHLVFLWLVLLPVGETLTLGGWTAAGGAPPDTWTSATVPGAAVRAFLANMALVYLVAGLYKFTSPMWRQGVALHAILRMPIAWTPAAWTPRWSPALRGLNHGALLLEPVLALLFFLPAGSASKWLLVLGALGFHLGIVLTLKIPFANLAMLGALPLALGPETMAALGRPLPTGPPVWTPADPWALALVAALALMVVWEVARSRWAGRVRLWSTHMSGFLGNPFYVGLWLVGVAQSYRLFDWVDDRNWHVRFDARRLAPGASSPVRVDPRELFPTTLRHLLLQSYLVGNVWLQLPPADRRRVRASLLARHARRYARRHPGCGTVEVHVTVQRVTGDNLALRRGRRSLLMRFRGEQDGTATLLHPAPPTREVLCVGS